MVIIFFHQIHIKDLKVKRRVSHHNIARSKFRKKDAPDTLLRVLPSRYHLPFPNQCGKFGVPSTNNDRNTVENPA